MESTSGILAKDDLTTFHNLFLVMFQTQLVCNPTSLRCYDRVKVRGLGWPQLNVNPILLVWKQDVLLLAFGVVILLNTHFKRARSQYMKLRNP